VPNQFGCRASGSQISQNQTSSKKIMNSNDNNTLAEVGVAAGGTIATVVVAAIAPEVLAVAGIGLVLFGILGALCSDGSSE
jgi:hypothetical protein